MKAKYGWSIKASARQKNLHATLGFPDHAGGDGGQRATVSQDNYIQGRQMSHSAHKIDEALKKDFVALCAKHNLTNAGFCAEQENKSYIGWFCVDKAEPGIADFLAGVEPIGRLYQAMRERTKGILDSFERNWE